MSAIPLDDLVKMNPKTLALLLTSENYTKNIRQKVTPEQANEMIEAGKRKKAQKEEEEDQRAIIFRVGEYVLE